jgi:catalase
VGAADARRVTGDDTNFNKETLRLAEINDSQTLTTSAGFPVADNQNSLTAGPHCPHATKARTLHRDGAMRADGNGGASPNYEPNSFGGPRPDPRYAEPPLKISGDADRYDHRVGNDDYTQAGDLFRLMKEDERERLISNIVASMRGVPREIQLRQIAHFTRADAAYGAGVAQGLGLGSTGAAAS